MKTNLTTIIVASCALSGVATAGRSPSGPDFHAARGASDLITNLGALRNEHAL